MKCSLMGKKIFKKTTAEYCDRDDLKILTCEDVDRSSAFELQSINFITIVFLLIVFRSLFNQVYLF